MVTLKRVCQKAGDHEESLGTALENNVRPIQKLSEIKQELGNIGNSSKRFVHAYTPLFGPLASSVKSIPCGVASAISKTVCLPNTLFDKVFRSSGTFSTVTRILSSVTGVPCRISQSSAKLVCNPHKSFPKIMNKSHRGGRVGNMAGDEFSMIFNIHHNEWYPIESQKGRNTLIDYLTYVIESEN